MDNDFGFEEIPACGPSSGPISSCELVNLYLDTDIKTFERKELGERLLWKDEMDKKTLERLYKQLEVLRKEADKVVIEIYNLKRSIDG